MKITYAIPAHLDKSCLSETEARELAKFAERVMTVEEIEAREIEIAEAETRRVENENLVARKKIIEALDEIDRKSIRALRTNDMGRLQELESEAATLRQSLKQGE